MLTMPTPNQNPLTTDEWMSRFRGWLQNEWIANESQLVQATQEQRALYPIAAASRRESTHSEVLLRYCDVCLKVAQLKMERTEMKPIYHAVLAGGTDISIADAAVYRLFLRFCNEDESVQGRLGKLDTYMAELGED